MKRGDNIGLGAAAADAAQATEEAALKNAIKALEEAGLLPVTAPELIARQFAPVEWIVEDLLATRGGTSRGFKGDIIAGSKMRKTFFALQLAACVSAGRDFLRSDTFAGFKVPKARRVLYLNLELREDFAQERIRRLADALGADFAKLSIMSPAKGYLVRDHWQIERSGEKTHLEGYEEQFLEFLRGSGVELLVVDPQYKLLFPEEDENSGQGIGGILRWRDRIITETGAACLMVHHDNKKGGTDKELTERGSGSGFAGRDYDARLALDAHADGDSEHEVLECGSRVRAAPDPVTVVFDTGTFTFEVDTNIPSQRKTNKPTKVEAATEAEMDCAHAEEAVQRILTAKEREVEADAESAGRAPDPVGYLYRGTESFKVELGKAANLRGKRLERQYKRLLELGDITWNAEIIRDGDKLKNSATIYHGLPERVEAYRKSFGLNPKGLELRGGDPRRPLKV